jgi:hypothetical protein
LQCLITGKCLLLTSGLETLTTSEEPNVESGSSKTPIDSASNLPEDDPNAEPLKHDAKAQDLTSDVSSSAAPAHYGLNQLLDLSESLEASSRDVARPRLDPSAVALINRHIQANDRLDANLQD